MEKHYYGWDPKIAARKELNRAIFSETLAKNADQCVLQEILGTIDDDELWAAASAYSLRKLVRQLPDSHRRQSLKEYAKRLDDVARKRVE